MARLMWFLPTRGKPADCSALIAAMEEVGDVPHVAVMIDDDPKVYAGVEWPAHWKIHVSPQHLEMTKAINTLLSMYPGEKTYGFFGDHFRPLTKWSQPLREAACDWFMAWPNDGRISHRQPSGAPTFGGKLARALGWICLPETKHLCTDRVWWFLWKQLGIAKHVAHVHYTRHWGQAERDRNYKGVNLKQADYFAWLKWRDLEAPAVIHSLREAMLKDGIAFSGERVVGCSPFVEGW
jgi:hypothetical protein